MENYKEIEIILKNSAVVEYECEVVQLEEKDSDLLNAVYKEIADSLGMDTAMDIYRMFKGQQITFPVRFLNPIHARRLIIDEYDGTNIKQLATKYNYSEKTVRRIVRDSLEKDKNLVDLKR